MLPMLEANLLLSILSPGSMEKYRIVLRRIDEEVTGVPHAVRSVNRESGVE